MGGEGRIIWMATEGSEWWSSNLECYLRRLVWKGFPDSDVSIYLDCFQRDKMAWKHKTHLSQWWGSVVSGVRVIMAASNSCSADFCPLETDVCSVNMRLKASQFRPELWSQRWEASVSSAKPFSLFLWRKIDFKKAINLQWFISSDHLHFLLLIIRLYYIVLFFS